MSSNHSAKPKNFPFIFLFFFCFAVCLSITFLTKASAQKKDEVHHQIDFDKFVANIRKEALRQGVSQATLDKYLTGLKAPRPAPLHNLHHQAQQEETFPAYFKAFVPPKSILRGRLAMKQYHDLLTNIENRFHVQPQYIISLWGVETYYGKYTGHSPIVASLVTLSYQKHRSQYYRDELFAALRMLNHQRIPEQAISEWDGGMGLPSFEPTSYFAYGVDFDNDGFKNIWTSVPDALASIANYLQKNGWKENQPWGMAVKVPANFPTALAGRKIQKTITEWKALGISPLYHSHFPDIDSKASVILLKSSGKNPPLAFLVFHNFKVLLRWNNTTFEATSVGILADKLL